VAALALGCLLIGLISGFGCSTLRRSGIKIRSRQALNKPLSLSRIRPSRAHFNRGLSWVSQAETEGKIEISLPEFLDSKYPFVLDTLQNRVPDKIIGRTIEFNEEKLTSEQKSRLRALAQEMKDNAPLTPIFDGKGDASDWNTSLEPFVSSGMRWSDVPWLVWETYLYRRMLEAADYWDTGLDLFAEEKKQGLESTLTGVTQRVEAVDEFGGIWTKEVSNLVYS